MEVQEAAPAAVVEAAEAAAGSRGRLFKRFLKPVLFVVGQLAGSGSASRWIEAPLVCSGDVKLSVGDDRQPNRAEFYKCTIFFPYQDR
jgi:hypothetical protein